MASVHLLSAAPAAEEKAHLDLKQMRDSAHADRFGVHRLSEDPVSADLILFVETSGAAGYYFERVRSHPVYRSHREKSYLFSATDRAVPFLPGVYAGIEKRWYWPAWTRAGFYPGVREEGLFHFRPGRRPAKLFSFVGSGAAHPVRRRVLELEHPNALLHDSSDEVGENGGEASPGDSEGTGAFARRYVESIADSAFVLCPRGGGAASFRLFEAMMLGRAPLVLSDQWVPPTGPDWDSFSLRLPEAEVGAIPTLLEARAAEAAAMGERARQAWLDWFAPEAGFHHTVEWCLELEGVASSRAGLRRYAPYLQMLRPYHAARALAKRLGHGRGAST